MSTKAHRSTSPHAPQTAGRVLVESLRLHGVDRVYCVPGESYLEVLDALYDAADYIELIVAKHEGGAANMAEADGKMTGRPGICMVTRGPGATHASIGIHTAQQDSTPLIVFVGQIARDQMGREAFQEVDYCAMFGKLAKWVVEVTDASRMAEIVARAFHTATSGRPGPVVVSLPEDMLTQTTHQLAFASTPLEPRAPTPAAMQRIAALLASAQRPLVVVGGSGWTQEASSDLARFAAAWSLPVACAFRRQDVLDNRHPQYVGHMSLGMNAALKELIQDADVILALGTRLGDVSTDSYTLLEVPVPRQKLIHVHVDSAEIGRVYRPTIGLNADTAPTLEALAGLAPPQSVGWSDWAGNARKAHERFSQLPERPAEVRGVDLGRAIQHASAQLPDDTLVTNGAGNYSVWLHRFYTYRNVRTELATTCGAMGYGVPAAVAAALRHRDREVLCVAGDGCFLMYPQELATAAEHGLRLIVLVVNNGMYGTIRMHQEKHYPGRVSGTRLAGPDYVGLARALGAAHAEQVLDTDQFPAAFARARAAGGFALLELVTDPKQITPTMRLD
ncbi:thiamine pyrophosphate-binding protein [Comamonas endophytica]|uniref:Thiamine pyrophosphate-binding protein n=1 Tax=Comamonas endophytica TaxID=2949090 RepID=A0ABY6GGY4_9BURK|nr:MULTISPECIES: thiamine pyrophosphate-binding protein [unclassified Acidovorax]MCD2514338.1 thiamine pyrophosphate-binding protein [Acidovorax sp. D4N7]UYG53632.1 thiamine pyrophosphate-binding protein [Acidovorax sp. 5MLIR]